MTAWLLRALAVGFVAFGVYTIASGVRAWRSQGATRTGVGRILMGVAAGIFALDAPGLARPDRWSDAQYAALIATGLALFMTGMWMSADRPRRPGDREPQGGEPDRA